MHRLRHPSTSGSMTDADTSGIASAALFLAFDESTLSHRKRIARRRRRAGLIETYSSSQL